MRRPVEQQVAQYAAADSGEHSQCRDSEQVKPFATPTVAPDDANTAMPTESELASHNAVDGVGKTVLAGQRCGDNYPAVR